MTMESLLFEDGGNFDLHVKKTRRLLDAKVKQFEALSSIVSKAKYLREHGPSFDIVPPFKPLFDLEKSMAYKEEGNKLFKQNRHNEAKDLYTKSLQCYPVNHQDDGCNKDFAITYANRSATFDHGNLFQAAIQDIDLAFKYGYPRELHFKIYNRKGHALLKRKQYVDSRAIFNKCRDMIGKSEMPTKQREQWRIKLAKQMSVFNVSKELKNIPLPERPWTQQADKNPCLLEVDQQKKQVVAGTDVNFEEILMTEQPFAAVLLTGGRSEGKMCPYTLQRMPSGIPCKLGSPTLFGSEEARDRASESFHQYEYKATEAFRQAGLTGFAKLAYRIITTIQPEKIGGLVKTLEDKAKANEQDKELVDLFRLPIGTVNSRDALAIIQLVNYFLQCLKEHGYVNSNEEEEEAVIKLVYRSILVAAKHGQAVFLANPPAKLSDLWNLNKFPTSEYAVAIYPKFSHLRSITNIKNKNKGSEIGPDVNLFYQDSKLFVQAIRKLKKGQNVDINWDSEAKVEQVLNDMVNFRCAGPNCTLSFPLKEKTTEKVIKCPLEECGVETNIWKRVKRMVELKKDHETAKKELEDKKFRSCVAFLEDIIKEWEDLVYRPHKEVNSLENDLKKAIQLENAITEQEWFDATR